MLLSGAERLDTLNRVLTESLAAFRVEPPVLCDDWCRSNFRLSGESASETGAWDPVPYQPGLQNMMCCDEIVVLVVRKSTRVGYTASFVGAKSYTHIQRRRKSLTYFPNDQLASDHMKSRVRPALRDVLSFSDVRELKGRAIGEDTLKTVYLTGSIMRILGGDSAANYSSFDTDLLIFDELDRFKNDIEGEGDPVKLGMNRCKNSPRPKTILGSTPKTQGTSLIEKHEEECDIHMRFFVACPDCHGMQYLRWGGADATSGLTYNREEIENGGEAHYICTHCSVVLDWSQQAKMLESGEWRDRDGRVRLVGDSLFDVDTGEFVEWPDKVGVFIWTAYSPFTTWTEIAQADIDAGDDLEKRKSFLNTWLGFYYIEREIVVQPDYLHQRREVYDGADANPAVVPEDVELLTMGVDVQGDRIECEVVGWGQGEESWSIDYVVLEGDTLLDGVWRKLQSLMQSQFTKPSGEKMSVSMTCIDSGYLTDEVYRFVRRMGRLKCMAVKGASTYEAPLLKIPLKPSRDNRLKVLSVGTNTAYDTLYQRLRFRVPGPGYCHFPERDDKYDMEYFNQITGQSKIWRVYKGRNVLRYEQSYPRNESLDARVYAMCGLKYLQLRRGVDLYKGTESAPEPPESSNESSSLFDSDDDTSDLQKWLDDKQSSGRIY